MLTSHAGDKPGQKAEMKILEREIKRFGGRVPKNATTKTMKRILSELKAKASVKK
jgi:hypothetical protein